MNLLPLIDATTTGGLHRRPDIQVPAWTFWEHKTLNVHRVVALFTGDPILFAQAPGPLIRDMVARQFKSSWWRGLAFGVVLDTRGIILDPSLLKELVDIRNVGRGTWQWT